MRKDDALRILRSHRDDLKNLGVKTLAIFGSVARDDATEQSDIDVLVDIEEPITFDRYMDTKIYLEDLLGIPVDLVRVQALRPRIRPNVEKEAVYVT